VAKIERVTWVKDDEPKHYALTFYPLMGGAGRGVVIRSTTSPSACPWKK
jgi:hypothetical protein